MKAIVVAALLASAAGASAADFSPQTWPLGTRLAAEKREFDSWAPQTQRIVRGRNGIIAATVSPIAVEAGLDVLRKGGNAADAAATVALTQVTTQFGSVVSYAGIMTAIYYEAKTGKVYSLDAGYGTWRGETDPETIPQSDISALTGGPPPVGGQNLGRQVLLPGYMAGMEALERRFGRFGLRETLKPAIWYAENGVKVSPTLAALFQMRKAQLARTPQGREFLAQSGRDVPLAGDVFKQPKLAATLRRVARDGAREMYSGEWAKMFVAQVGRDGGKAAIADMARYRPVWSEAAAAPVFGHTVYTNAGTSYAPYQLFAGLNAAEALQLDRRGPYWSDAETLRDLNRLGAVLTNAPDLMPPVTAVLKAMGADTSRTGQLSKDYAGLLARALPQLFAARSTDPHHSNALVVADKDGNIVVMTHTINAVIWGDTGIVVGGIPVPDSAGFQQVRLKQVKPGDRLPNEIPDFLVLDGGKRPVLAGGAIGSSLLAEVLRIVVSRIAQHHPLVTIAAAPPLLANPDEKSYQLALSQWPVAVPVGAYEPALTAQLTAQGNPVVELPAATVAAWRSTVTLIGFEGRTKTAPEVPGVMVYAGAE